MREPAAVRRNETFVYMPRQIRYRLRFRARGERQSIRIRDLAGAGRVVDRLTVRREVRPRRPRTCGLRDLPRRTIRDRHHGNPIRVEDACRVLEDDSLAVRAPAWI